MSGSISPERLIVQAKALAGYVAGRGRPSPTDQRRAVSAAYYAVFHAIIGQAVLQILPLEVAAEDDRLRAARWIQHADVKQAAKWVVACAAVTGATSTPPGDTGSRHGVWELFSNPSAEGARTGDVPNGLYLIASTFIDLRDARHTADYDQLASFPKATTRRHIDDAENALLLLTTDTGDPHLRRFLALVLFRSRRLA